MQFFGPIVPVIGPAVETKYGIGMTPISSPITIVIPDSNKQKISPRLALLVSAHLNDSRLSREEQQFCLKLAKQVSENTLRFDQAIAKLM